MAGQLAGMLGVGKVRGYLIDRVAHNGRDGSFLAELLSGRVE